MEDDERQHLLGEIAKRDAEIAVLKQTIDALCRRVFGKSSEQLDPAQLELFDAPKKAPAADPADHGPAAEDPVRRDLRRQQPRPPRIPEHLSVIEQVPDPPEVLAAPDQWRRIGEEVREQLDYKPGRFLRIRLVRGKYVRKGDVLARPVVAPLPPSLLDRCIATPGLIAEIIDNRFVCHLPYYRQAEIFTRQGVSFHRKTLCDWAALGAHWLSSIYRAIQHEHWRSRYRQFDETPVDYLASGSGQAQTGYLWTSNIPHGTVVYHWRAGRDAGGITELFGDPGDTAPCTIQCDGYKAYPAWARDKQEITLMGCHAHVRRKFFEAKDQQPRLVAWILRQIGHLYRIEKELREAKAGPALREAIRVSHSRMIHRRLKKLFDRLALRAILPKSSLGKAVGHAIKEWSKLEVYLGDGRVEIDNNLVENAIRPTKLGAKNWLFIGCREAGQRAAILYTVVENCRRPGIDTREYLEDVLTRLPDMMASNAVTLTPANWLRARQGKPIRKAA
ncbi:IS66 family transposase [Luteolibacter sp. Populi]|uniref:IS66 family transposase n=1 Tax=Luteolibacter sp. Populi TaxID=3230487 RepID=UPI0034664AFE